MKGIYVSTGMFLEWGLQHLFDWDSGKVRADGSVGLRPCHLLLHH